MTQGLPPLPDLGSGLEVGERLPEGEWGQYESRRKEREAFEAYVKAVAPRTGMRELRALFGTYKSHGLYEGWVKIGRPVSVAPRPLSPQDVTRLGEKGIDTELLEAAGIPLGEETPGEETPQDRINAILEAQGAVEGAFGAIGDTGRVRPLPGETAAEWRARTGNQSAVLGDPVQEEHLGFKGYWGSDGYFYTWNELEGREQRVDFDASRVERQEPPGETEGERRRREASAREFGITEQRRFQESEATRLFREQQFEFQGETRRLEQEQFQQGLAGEREARLAQLAAQPISWLQHAALSGQTPVVQPWMIPLMRPGQNLQVGQPIPGFQGAAQAGSPGASGFLPGTSTPAPVGNTFANLPELRRPSAQLFARMGPTAQQQFLGFRQARTGIPPQETLFRQRQTGPPGSSGGGFQQQRLRV